MWLSLAIAGLSPIVRASPELGPSAVNLALAPEQQAALGRSGAAARFRARWGDAAIRWDPRNATPRFVALPGIPAADADEVAADLAVLAGVDPAALSAGAERSARDLLFRRYTRTFRGVDVAGDEIALAIRGGRIAGAWVRVTRIDPSLQLALGEEVVADESGVGRAAVRAGDAWRDRTGRIVASRPSVFSADVMVSCELRTVGDPLATFPARALTVSDSLGQTAVTDDDGHCDLAGPLVVGLTGPVVDVTLDGTELEVPFVDATTVVGGEDVPSGAASVVVHLGEIRDWALERWPDNEFVGLEVAATVHDTDADLIAQLGQCNSYFLPPASIGFFDPGDTGCYSWARIADFTYHEYTHGLHFHGIAAGTVAVDVSEGSADFGASNLLDDPHFGVGYAPGQDWLRDLSVDRRWPDDATGDPHNDGRIWSSFLWNLREQWIAERGDDGKRAVEDLFLDVLAQGPTLTDLGDAVLLADDDDGDLSNGTPDLCELEALLDAAGLGSGALGVTVLEHTALGPQPSDATGYPLAATLATPSSACGAAAPALEAWFTTDPKAPRPFVDVGWDRWTRVPLVADNGAWTGTIPRQPANTAVRYFFHLVSADGAESLSTSGGSEDPWNTFWVGDRATAWCDDLEGDLSGWSHGPGAPWEPAESSWTDDWALGTPPAGKWSDGTAASGSVAAGTGFDGAYSPDDLESLTGPEVALAPGGKMRLLTFERWLTVDDAERDQATVWVDDGAGPRQVWENPAGTGLYLEDGWTPAEVSLGDGATTARPTWALATSAVGGYGGWLLDDPCIVELADVAGHYRVRDLSARAIPAGVQASYTPPWVRPLGTVRLVRKEGGWPENHEDGVVVDEATAPPWGVARSVVDWTGPSADVRYAVFASDDGGTWYETRVEGENAAEIRLAPAKGCSTADAPISWGIWGFAAWILGRSASRGVVRLAQKRGALSGAYNPDGPASKA